MLWNRSGQLLPAHGDNAVKQALRRGHRHQRGALRPAAALPEDEYPAGVAAELRDIVADPFEGKHEIELSDITAVRKGIGERGTGKACEVEIAEEVEPVVQRDNDNIAAMDEVDAVIDRPVAAARGVGPAVNVDHDGTLAVVVQSCSPDIEMKAVLAVDGLYFIEQEKTKNVRRERGSAAAPAARRPVHHEHLSRQQASRAAGSDASQCRRRRERP